VAHLVTWRKIAISLTDWNAHVIIIVTMPRTREEILEERRRLKTEYGELFDTVSALLFRHDPIGIAFDNENSDEYDPEAGTILPRLRNCESVSDVQRVLHDEFVRWFDAGNAGPEERYALIASEIWELCRLRSNRRPDAAPHG
jgi:hypothetical protein